MRKYHIITFGCQMNKSDSERIASVLENMGYRSTSNEKEADLIVVNMCSVRQSAVDRVYGQYQKFAKLKIRKPKLKTILTGCILKEDQKKFAKRFDLILNIKDLSKLPQKISARGATPKTSGPLFCKQSYLNIKPKYQNSFLAYVPISNGCNNFCTYCVVPFTRGSLACRDHNEIFKEVKNVVKKGLNPIRNAISNGAREIWLLGQNVNDYQSPTNHLINFTKLLKMVNDIPGEFRILFISPHPKNFSDELIATLAKCEKFGKLLNLPVQSGDNRILKRMNRNYIVKEYKNLVKKIRENIPGIKLSTDVIVGFPGETKKTVSKYSKIV